MSHYHRDPSTGNFLPSVTTILQTMLPEPVGITKWKAKNKNWKKNLKESSETGTLVHFCLLNPLSGYILDPSDLPPYAKWYPDTVSKLELATMMFDEMVQREHLIFGFPRWVESKVFNIKEKYSGQIDLRCPVNGKMTLLDIKTSAAIYETHLLQLGGYFMPLKDEVEQVGIIKITPDSYKNPSLRADIHIYSASEARTWGDQFVALARKFHAQNRRPAEEDIELIN